MKVPEKYEGMGGDEFARFDKAMTRIMQVPYSELKRRIEADERSTGKKPKKKRAKKPASRDRV
ncbi:MAG TPA: hypothetical protein VKY85_00015 [Candidatus Angelobacter sp.]|nr:hypothetical protein [Candidatus Angelobacter sp.]